MLTFIFVVLALFLIPGPAVLITISQTLQGGLKNGVITGVGIAAGDLFHTLAAVLGLSAILMTSALAFEVVKYIGAAYLLYLGIKALVKKTSKTNTTAIKNSKVRPSFRQALLIEILNPKTALFFLAFLPQFVKSEGAPVAVQLLILGLTFVVMSVLYTTLLALLTSLIGEKLFAKMNNSAKRLDKAVGIIYISLGIKLAIETQE